MQFVPKHDHDMPLRNTIACTKADEAYSQEGLTFHPKKRVRRATVFQAWGAEIEGVEGLLGAKRSRISSLSCVTALCAKSQVATRHLLEVLLGCWAFILQFRRPLFSMIQKLYHIGSLDGLADTPFKLPREAQQELQLLAILGTTALTSMRTPVSSTLYGSDASPDGAGLIGCVVGQTVANELYRRCDSRGYHTRLLSPIEAFFHATGVDGADQDASNDLKPPQTVAAPADVLEENPTIQPQLVPESTCGTVSSKDPKLLETARRLQASSSAPLGPPCNFVLTLLKFMRGVQG